MHVRQGNEQTAVQVVRYPDDIKKPLLLNVDIVIGSIWAVVGNNMLDIITVILLLVIWLIFITIVELTIEDATNKAPFTVTVALTMLNACGHTMLMLLVRLFMFMIWVLALVTVPYTLEL